MSRHCPRILSALAVTLALAACVTTPVDESTIDNARDALEQAVSAGAEEYSPLELRFARERIEAAELALSEDRPGDARRMADQAEIEAQLALARTRAAKKRATLADKEAQLEQLRADLVAAFGEEVLE